MRTIRAFVPTFLADVADQLVGVAWLDPVLRSQLADAWKWVLDSSNVES